MSSSMLRRIVLPIGGTDREFLAQEHAMQMAEDLQLPVYAIHVSSRPENVPRDMFSFIVALGKRHGIPVDTRIISGTDVGVEIVAESSPLDLIVIGTRRLKSKFHISSVTQNIIQHAEGPVQVLRLEG